ncbi:insulinase family protein [Geomonas sp. RF6]|uniref:M16 family metallopeptidase n=1 Tax=Geomonas sp. RF6 TaxID=2897342 RepID=UPI001E47FB4E|nr:pitrilysin family protein [Geomonas sp. RF6]UFS70159.1 insulinase family protein [Geomonas sp. RF6]
MTTPRLPDVQMTTLSNGIRVATQQVNMQGAAIGIRIESSTRNEEPDTGGASHFIEHLLFKGTEKRSADRIMDEFNALGARANAYTSQEEVFYYAVCLASTIPQVFEILADMYVNASFPTKEVDKERGVVLQEISMNFDNPNRFLYNQFHQGYWIGHPVGLPILGTAETISSIARDRLVAHKLINYLANGTIVSVAGNVEHAPIVELAERLLGQLPVGALPSRPSHPAWQPALRQKAHHTRPMEQTQFYMGYPIPPAGSAQRHALAVLNQILGSGMNSRLFREVRERRSLAYSVYSHLQFYSDTGALLIYAATGPERAEEAVKVSHGEIMKLCDEMVGEDTLRDAKEQLRCNRLMALDDCEIQMRRISNNVSILGAPEPIAFSLEALEAVTAEDVRSLAQQLFGTVVPRVESVGPGEGPVLPE